MTSPNEIERRAVVDAGARAAVEKREPSPLVARAVAREHEMEDRWGDAILRAVSRTTVPAAPVPSEELRPGKDGLEQLIDGEWVPVS